MCLLSLSLTLPVYITWPSTTLFLFILLSVVRSVPRLLFDGLLLFHSHVNSRDIPLPSFMLHWKQFPLSYWSADCVPLQQTSFGFVGVSRWCAEVKSIVCLFSNSLSGWGRFLLFMMSPVQKRNYSLSLCAVYIRVWLHDYWQNPDIAHNIWQSSVLDVRGI